MPGVRLAIPRRRFSVALFAFRCAFWKRLSTLACWPTSLRMLVNLPFTALLNSGLPRAKSASAFHALRDRTHQRQARDADLMTGGGPGRRHPCKVRVANQSHASTVSEGSCYPKVGRTVCNPGGLGFQPWAEKCCCGGDPATVSTYAQRSTGHIRSRTGQPACFYT